MTSIDAATLRKVLDSRGNATVEAEIRVGRAIGRAAAASGASTGVHEAQALPAGGVDEALRTFRVEVAPKLVGHDAEDQAGVDDLLSRLDGTTNFSRIGGNVAVAVSLAVAKAAAAHAGVPLFRHLGGPKASAFPLPLGNVIGGGRHAIGGTTIQEFLVVSQGKSFAENAFANARVHRLVGQTLAKRFPAEPLGRGDEGAWIVKLADEDALTMIGTACRAVEAEVGFRVQPALDMAASEFYRDGRYLYRERALTPDEQIEFVERLVREHGLFGVEDPLDQEDFAGLADLTKRIGGRCRVIGDDIFVTSTERLQKGIRLGAGNAILIKPNQVGTLTDTRAAVDMAHEAGFATIVSHRSGETSDETIAHLAVAFGSLGIKTGTVGGERTAKLNELIRIEEQIRGGN